MPFLAVNGAQIFYQAFGAENSLSAPIVLIHGSTSTGANDWAEVAVRLAERWRVLAPDCRGHGQSTNPNTSYSFFEMAADVATFVRKLGYERAPHWTQQRWQCGVSNIDGTPRSSGQRRAPSGQRLRERGFAST